MFTGIVTEIGNIIAIEDRGDRRVTVSCAMDPAKIAMGASIACSGVCLTVVDKGGVAGEAWFAVDVSGETVSRTAPAQWQAGRPINLEPALKLGDELGGHIVTGHVDAVGEVVGICPKAPRTGSASPHQGTRTVHRAQGLDHGGRRIADRQRSDRPARWHGALRAEHHPPHRRGHHARPPCPGDKVNLEIDVLARYLKRMQSLAAPA
jgi:riboflavin synthase